MIHQQYKFTAFGDCPIDCAINIIVEYTEDVLSAFCLSNSYEKIKTDV